MNILDIKRPVRLGEVYNVPCIVKAEDGHLFITPVIDHPHSDRENGQTEIHYHADYRFIRTDLNLKPVRNHSRHIYLHAERPVVGRDGHLIHYPLPVVSEQFANITHPNLIRRSKMKRKCIHRGRCPHRGYDLSQVAPVDGVITCPLHGLRFDASTNVIINP
jgi:hypothetical protein